MNTTHRLSNAMFRKIVQIYIEHDKYATPISFGKWSQASTLFGDILIILLYHVVESLIHWHSGVVAHITCDGFLNHFTLETEVKNKYYLEIPKSNHRHCHTSQASHGFWHAPHFHTATVPYSDTRVYTTP